MKLRTRVHRLAGLVWTSVLLCGIAHAEPAPAMLTEPRNLQQEASDAQAARKPLVLLFSLPGCPYCKVIRQNYLWPLLRDNPPAERPVIRELEITSRQPLRDFDGTLTTPAALAARYGVQVAPTVLFLNAQGQLLADPLVGGDGNGFYSGYLDRALEDAASQLGRPRARPR